MILHGSLPRPVCVQCRLLLSSRPASRVFASRRWLSHTSGRLLGKPAQLGSTSKGALPDGPARTRFAPSPTGYLHLGSLRTALYSFLLARATKGQFVLRIEDTDQNRLVHDAESRLYDDLRWSGLEWDEGPDKGGPYGPYRQSERLAIYRTHADQLLENGHAFRCFCTKEEIWLQKEETGQKPYVDTPGPCLGISPEESADRAAKGEAHVVRFKSPTTPVTVIDHVYGSYTKNEKESDFVILKSDGFPSYHLANVVDDHLMKITHVVRGAEWLISTPIHEQLYRAFGWQPPVFAHLGLMFHMSGEKLSKRGGSIDIGHYREMKDYFPEALVNFVAVHGWNPVAPTAGPKPKTVKGAPGPSEAQGPMTMTEMIDKFSMRFTKGDIKVDMNKLASTQGKLLTRLLADPTPDPEALDTVTQSARMMLREIQRVVTLTGEEGSSTEVPLPSSNSSSPTPYFARPSTCAGDLSPELVPRVRDLDSDEAGNYILDVLRASRHSSPVASSKIALGHMHFFRLSYEGLRKSYVKLSERIESVKVDYKPSTIHGAMKYIYGMLEQLPTTDGEWEQETLKKALDQMAVQGKKKVPKKEQRPGTVFKNSHEFFRWALLDSNPGPAMLQLLQLLGREEVMLRIANALRAIEDVEAQKADPSRMFERECKITAEAKGDSGCSF